MNELAAVFVYEHNKSGDINVLWLDDAKEMELDDDWTLIASIEPRAYISFVLNEFPPLVGSLKGDMNKAKSNP